MTDPTDDTPDDVVLPCGCLLRHAIVNGAKTMTVSPCRQDCVNFRNLLDLAREKGIAPECRRG
jgi:hypothetical protein